MRLGLILVAACTTTAACGDGADPARATADTPFGRVTAQYLAGDLADVTGVTTRAVEVQYMSAGLRFDAVSALPSWWLMTQVLFDPPLSDARWAPGVAVTSEPISGEPGALRVSALGCSGPSRGHYTFDGLATRVAVRIEPGHTPSARQVTYTVYWANAGGRPGTLSGAFEYDPN